MTEHDNLTEHKERQIHRVGNSPGYRAFHEVYITKDLGSQRNQEVIAFIDKKIADFNGKIENKHGIPLMLFEKKMDAERFAKDISARLNVPQEHITVKARKYTR